ncbi:MAG TPA: hypothetical protein VFS16_08370 [Acidimicrobiia bacterium]|nr:hypothetical protein [Acidimicrobiia bacterium]
MERGSDKHSARVDEELERETRSLTHGGAPAEARSEEFSMEELVGDEDDPTPEEFIDDRRP